MRQCLILSVRTLPTLLQRRASNIDSASSFLSLRFSSSRLLSRRAWTLPCRHTGLRQCKDASESPGLRHNTAIGIFAPSAPSALQLSVLAESALLHLCLRFDGVKFKPSLPGCKVSEILQTFERTPYRRHRARSCAHWISSRVLFRLQQLLPARKRAWRWRCPELPCQSDPRL